MYIYIYPSLSLSLHLSPSLSISLSLYFSPSLLLSLSLSICLSLSFFLSFFLSLSLSMSLSLSLCPSLSLSLSLYVPLSLSICPSLSLSLPLSRVPPPLSLPPSLYVALPVFVYPCLYFCLGPQSESCAAKSGKKGIGTHKWSAQGQPWPPRGGDAIPTPSAVLWSYSQFCVRTREPGFSLELLAMGPVQCRWPLWCGQRPFFTYYSLWEHLVWFSMLRYLGNIKNQQITCDPSGVSAPSGPKTEKKKVSKRVFWGGPRKYLKT